MNAFDVVVIALLVLFALYGAVKGLVRLLLGFAAILLALALGAWFHVELAAKLPEWIHGDAARKLAATGLIFFGTLVVAAIVIWAIQKALAAVKLRWVDRLTGALLGAALGCLLVASAMVPLTAFLPPGNLLVQESAIAPYVLQISSALRLLVPKDLKARFEEGRAKLEEAAKGGR